MPYESGFFDVTTHINYEISICNTIVFCLSTL